MNDGWGQQTLWGGPCGGWVLETLAVLEAVYPGESPGNPVGLMVGPGPLAQWTHGSEGPS